MGLAIISSWNKKNISQNLKIFAVDSNKSIRNSVEKKFKKVSVSEKIPENWLGEIVILAVKPQVFSLVAKEILKKNIQTKVIMSIMAGIKIKTINASLKIKTDIIRVMPNIASELGLGVNCIYYNKNINQRYLKKIKNLLKELGNVYKVKNERLIGCDMYVNDAFSCSHRAHSSIEGITKYIPSYCGLQFVEEINALKRITSKIVRPVTCIIGGSKVSTKINIISNLIKNVDNIIIVGAMANNFLIYKNLKIGKSLIEKNTEETIKKIYEKEIDAFGTLFTLISFEKIGTSAIQSRATAGVAGGK